MNRNTTITIVLLFSLTAIIANAQDKINILASASMWADMTENIVGDRANVDRIVPIGGDPHTYEPTPSDATKVTNADLILINGLTFEGWITDLIKNSGTEAKTVLITKEVNPISSDVYKDATDPHAWMDASNGRLYAKAIYEALLNYDAANKKYYTERYAEYDQEISNLHTMIKKSVSRIPESQRVLITSHDAFKYYGEAYGLQLEAIQGISTEAEAQLSDMKRVSDAITRHNVPAVFVESTINPKMLQQIAKDNNIAIGGELYADSLGDKDSEGGTYIGMLQHNTEVIVDALTKTRNAEVKIEQGKNDTYLYVILGLVLLTIMGVVFSRLNK